VVIDDFDLVGIAVPPFKADSVLLVDSNAPLPFSIASQTLQPISWGYSQFLDPRRAMNLAKFPKCHPLACPKFPAVMALKNLFRLFIGKSADHA
jgi:hypothetical protein